MTPEATPPHCSDADLLALLDGELPLVRRMRADWHLSRCWQCRARRAELDAQAQAFARAVGGDTFPSADRVMEARLRFEQRRRAFAPPAAVARVRWPWLLGPALAGVTLALVFWRAPAPPLAPRPVAAIPSTPPPVVPAPKPAPLEAVKPVAPKPVDWRALEVDVHYRLHRIGACGAEPVLVARAQERGPITVSAIAPPAGREQEIRAALRDLTGKGLVRIDITALEQRPLPLEALGDTASNGRTQATLDERTQTILREVDVIYAHAWAMHRHAALGHRLLDRNTAWLLDAMRREHAAELEPAAARLRRALGDGFPNQPAAALDEFEAAKEMTELVHRLFAPGPNDPPADAGREAARLAALLAVFHRARR